MITDWMKNRVESLFQDISSPKFFLKTDDRVLIEKIINRVDSGEIRSAEKINEKWIVNDYIKKAILLYMRTAKSGKMCIDFENYLHESGTSIYYQANNIGGRFTNLDNSYGMKYYDKMPLKFAHFLEEDFEELDSRIVPGAIVRFGAFIGKRTILMPCFVNVGAYIGDGTMIDAWSTVGSCAQIGKNCHISGGVGIGGVLEPASSIPVIIEDNVFIGARSEIAEGVIVEEGSVVSTGVHLSASTKIVDRETGEIIYGRVPAGSVVISGGMPSKNNTILYSAIIIKKVDDKTRKKTSINEILRD